MGKPLQPGTYYVAVYNGSAPVPASWTLLSRGIGDGFLIPVVDLPFSGGSVTNLGLAPREAAYYRVVVPSGASSWQTKLTTLTGEAMLVALTKFVPSILTGQSSSDGKAMLKSTNEHFLRLPLSGQAEILPGTNYLAVISEGVTNAAFPSRIGTGTSSYVLESRGPLAVVNLGEVSAQETTHTGSAMDTERTTTEADLERTTAERAQVAGSISSEVLALFDRLSKHRKGLAMSEAKDGLCTQCNVRLRPQVYNELRRNESVMQCESCSRILYFVAPAGAAEPVASPEPESAPAEPGS